MSADGLAGLLRSFRVPTMAAVWEESAGRAERENWGYRRFLQHLCECEAQDRRERKIQRLLKGSTARRQDDGQSGREPVAS